MYGLGVSFGCLGGGGIVKEEMEFREPFLRAFL